VTQFKQALKVMFSLALCQAGGRDHSGVVNFLGYLCAREEPRQVEPIRDLTSNFSGLAVTMIRY
jgi:hypothetical protein